MNSMVGAVGIETARSIENTQVIENKQPRNPLKTQNWAESDTRLTRGKSLLFIRPVLLWAPMRGTPKGDYMCQLGSFEENTFRATGTPSIVPSSMKEWDCIVGRSTF
jgi:hypothetical protein